ncbi:MAG: tyrosine-type recombinase/integrase [Desulfobacterales bacterium]|jgi:integrase
MTACNRPSKGARIKVEPIRYQADIKRIKNLLNNRPRDLGLFTLGINTPLHISDLLNLTIEDVGHLSPGDSMVVYEKRNGRRLNLGFNRVCCAAVENIKRYRAEKGSPEDSVNFLFPSRRGDKLLPSSVHRLVKSWCHAVGLKGNYGANSLRKTWGYHQFATFGTDLSRLMSYFNHATRRQTLDYLCLIPDDFKRIFDHEL